VQLYRDAEAADEVGHQGVCHCQCLWVGDGLNFWPLGEVVHGDISFPCHSRWKAQQCQLWSFWNAPWRIGASGPNFWFWYLSWWHRRHTVDTTSLRCLLSTANSNADGPCWQSCYLHDVLQMCRYASPPVFPSPCCGGWQSELATSFCQLIPSDVPARHLSPQGISTGPNSSCRWGSCCWCTFALGIIQPPLPIIQPPLPTVVAQQIHFSILPY
jgi:hypothetical protein